MPVINTPDGHSRYLDAEQYAQRFTELRDKPELSVPERAELECFQEHERASSRLAALATNPAARVGGTDPASGYDQAQQRHRDGSAVPSDRGGWLTQPGADPNLQRHRSNAMGALERYQRTGDLSPAAADRADAVLRHGDPQGLTARYLAAIADPHYATAFGRMIADPQMGHLRYSPEEVAAVREASHAEAATRAGITTGATGFPLPLQIDPTIVITGAGALNPVRDISNVITIGAHDWIGVSTDSVTAAYVQEGTEATDATPTLAGPRISTQQARAVCQFTIESGMDWPSLQSQLVGLVADARNTLDAQMFLTGTGTNQPFGIFGGSATYSLTTTQRVQTATAATYVAADNWLLKGALPPRFISTATFAAAPGTWDTAFQLVPQGSTTLAQQFADSDRGGDFLGRPKVEWSTMATGSATGTKLIVAGDFKTGYKIVDRIGMVAELIPHMFGATNRLPLGMRALYVYWRTGAGVIAQNAFRYLEVK